MKLVMIGLMVVVAIAAYYHVGLISRSSQTSYPPQRHQWGRHAGGLGTELRKSGFATGQLLRHGTGLWRVIARAVLAIPLLALVLVGCEDSSTTVTKETASPIQCRLRQLSVMDC